MKVRNHVAVLLVGASSACSPVRPASTVSSAPLPATLTNAVGMEFVLIRPGSMRVGRFEPVCPVPGANGEPEFVFARTAPSPSAPVVESGAQWTAADYAQCEELARRDATPGFVVTIDQPYYLGTYEVTQAQWKRVMGTNPSVFQGSRVPDDADRHPVDNVSWDDAQAFIRRLNQLDRTARYRLPTEWEWEYAARAGAQQDLSWDEARAQAQTSQTSTLMVGQKKPNAWGLYDMLGNVWEWVADFYNEELFGDPTPPTSGDAHVLKGASFLGDVKNLTYTTHGAGPANRWDVGFRVLREAR